MRMKQREAIDAHLEELMEILRFNFHQLLSHLSRHGIISFVERTIIECHTTSDERLVVLLNIMKTKDSGWDALIAYLCDNCYMVMASKLQQHVITDTKIKPIVTMLDSFSLKLAQYYEANSALWTLYRTPQHVENVWVPLAIREDTTRIGEQFDLQILLQRLKHDERARVNLITANPGSGKTALIKKISHSWAIRRLDDRLTPDDFTLVLLVPLRSARKCEDLLQMAVRYFLDIFRLPELSEISLTAQLRDLRSNLLLCLDGLEEYHNFDQSPFSSLFACPFDRNHKYFRPIPIPYFPYKLIITARPYACEILHADFLPLRFCICPFENSQLEEFIHIYCQTEAGKKKVKKYFQSSENCETVKIPLLLTFICYLADTTDMIPGNQTLMYEKVLYHMLKRERMGNKLAESFDLSMKGNYWQETNVVVSTANLAFYGCEEKKSVFGDEDLVLYQIPNDAFVSGYLLRNFDFDQDRVTAEFPNNSIQEYFAALHVYQQMIKGEIPKTGVVAEVIAEHNLFTRFLLGIASNNGCLPKLIEWITNDTNAIGALTKKLDRNEATADCTSEGLMMLKKSHIS